MKCIQCKKEAENPIFIGMDGDAVCSDACRRAFDREMSRVARMSSKEFVKHMVNGTGIREDEVADIL